MTIDTLAADAQVARITVIRLERGDSVNLQMRKKIAAALERAGNHFLSDGGVRPPREAA